jgi:hypothetical protein
MEPLELAFSVDCPVEGAFVSFEPKPLELAFSVDCPVEGAFVSFEPAAERTEVMIVHRGWERLGSVADERRERNRRGGEGVTERYWAASAKAA